MSRGGESLTQGEIPRLLFGFERGKLRPFSFCAKMEFWLSFPLFRSEFFFCFFTEDRRHALSFLGKGADEVLLLLFGSCFSFGFMV